jgi:hypothetical protein
MKDLRLDPWHESYDDEYANGIVELVVNDALSSMTSLGFKLPRPGVDTTNLTNAIWELMGTYNHGATYDIRNPQFEGKE